MHVNDGTRERGADHPVHDRLHAGKAPVPGIDGVAHGRQPERGDLAEDGGVPRVVGRAQALRRRAGYGLDLGLGHVDLGRDTRGGDRGEVGMAPGVVLDREPSSRHHLRVLGVGGHLLADLEEGGRHLVALEHGEHLRGVRTWAVVEGEGNDPLARRRRPARSLERSERWLAVRRRARAGCRHGPGYQEQQRDWTKCRTHRPSHTLRRHGLPSSRNRRRPPGS